MEGYRMKLVESPNASTVMKEGKMMMPGTPCLSMRHFNCTGRTWWPPYKFWSMGVRRCWTWRKGEVNAYDLDEIPLVAINRSRIWKFRYAPLGPPHPHISSTVGGIHLSFHPDETSPFPWKVRQFIFVSFTGSKQILWFWRGFWLQLEPKLHWWKKRQSSKM